MSFNLSQITNLYPLLIVFVWLTGLSLLFYRLTRHYRRLAKSSSGSLEKVLDTLLNQIADQQKQLDKTQTIIDTIKTASQNHIQKIGLVRFNPFEETGGKHSFSVSLLDNLKNGLVLTSLHARDKTRWYAKQVIKGTALEHKLNEEEKQAIKNAYE